MKHTRPLITIGNCISSVRAIPAKYDPHPRKKLVKTQKRVWRCIHPLIARCVKAYVKSFNMFSGSLLKVRHNAEVGADIAIELAALEGYRPHRGPAQSGPSAGVSVAPSQVSARSRSAPVAPHRPGRVAVFGGAVADIVSKPYPGTPLSPGTSNPGETRQSFGGVGRNVAEGVARVLLVRQSLMGATDCDSGGSSSDSSSGNGSGGGGGSGVADVTLVAAVGEDDVGRALVAGCEDVGVSAQATVEVVSGTGQGGRVVGSELCPGTASYVAILGDDGDLVTAVADMRVMEEMTAVSFTFYLLSNCPHVFRRNNTWI